MLKCDVLTSRHAFERLEARGISSVEVKDALLRGSKRQNPDGTMVARCGFCEVVYKRKPCRYFVITVQIASD